MFTCLELLTSTCMIMHHMIWGNIDFKFLFALLPELKYQFLQNGVNVKLLHNTKHITCVKNVKHTISGCVKDVSFVYITFYLKKHTTATGTFHKWGLFLQIATVYSTYRIYNLSPLLNLFWLTFVYTRVICIVWFYDL